jgi:hypothetical protein
MAIQAERRVKEGDGYRASGAGAGLEGHRRTNASVGRSRGSLQGAMGEASVGDGAGASLSRSMLGHRSKQRGASIRE